MPLCYICICLHFYRLLAGNEDGVFTIVVDDGTIKLEKNPLRTMYTLTVEASDVEDSTKTATVQAIIQVDACRFHFVCSNKVLLVFLTGIEFKNALAL